MSNVKPAATQVAHPWKATVRTMLAAAVPTIITLVTVINIVTDQFGVYLSPAVIGWLTGAAGFLVVLSGAITRIMAVPGVNDFLKTIGLGATPKASPTVEYKSHFNLEGE